jgi:hypothetical protein
MRICKTAPFNKPLEDAFASQNWHDGNGEPLEDGSLVRNWDQQTQLEVFRNVEVDLKVFTAIAPLYQDARLSFHSTWWSDGTGLRGRGETVEFKAEIHGRPKPSFRLSMTVPGSQLAGKLQLRSALVLVEASPGMKQSSIYAKRPGSILWEDHTTVTLEGGAPRFPITVVDFLESGLGPENACWSFEWRPADLALPAMATMRLFLNSRHHVFHEAAVSQVPDGVQKAIISSLKYGLAEEMITRALDVAGELVNTDDDFLNGSSGRVFLDLLERIFPGMDPMACREFREKDPVRFKAEIQARTALYADISKGVQQK